MSWPKPCELIKVKSKQDLSFSIRKNNGVFHEYILQKGRSFLGFRGGDEEKAFISTEVLQIIEVDDYNTVIFETLNSVYWLVPIDIRVVHDAE